MECGDRATSVGPRSFRNVSFLHPGEGWIAVGFDSRRKFARGRGGEVYVCVRAGKVTRSRTPRRGGGIYVGGEKKGEKRETRG